MSEPLPEQTTDDLEHDWRDRDDLVSYDADTGHAAKDDDRLTRERPPHWE